MREPSLSWSSPLPPTRSGVADYAFELLPELAKLCPLRVVKPPQWVGPEPPWAGEVAWVDAGAPPTPWELCHLGNNPYHLWVAKRARQGGSLVVLHDVVLHHLLVEEAAAEGAWERFADELEAACGKAGRALAWARQWGFAGPLDPFLFPAFQPFLAAARGVVVHSKWAAEAVARAFPHLPVLHVPLAVADLRRGDGRALRQQLGMGEQELLAVHLGFLTPAKGLREILQAFAVAAQLALPWRLLVVGEGSQGQALEGEVKALGLASRVKLSGYVSAERLGEILAACDLGLVLRYPTAGETSAAVLRFFAAGRPVVICGYQQFLEFPPEVALRVRPGEEGTMELVRWLGFLALHRDSLEAKKRQAREFWQQGKHKPEEAAKALWAALKALPGEGFREGLAPARGKRG